MGNTKIDADFPLIFSMKGISLGVQMKVQVWQLVLLVLGCLLLVRVLMLLGLEPR
jgi:hypothetical protein